MTEKTYYQGQPDAKVSLLWILYFGFVLTVLAVAGSVVILRVLSIGPVFAVAIMFFVASVVYFIALAKTYHYRITDKGVYFKGGIFVKRDKFVPFFKITNIEITQGILEQILALKRLSFQTAGTGGVALPEIVFEGLVDAEEPKRIAYHFIQFTR